MKEKTAFFAVSRHKAEKFNTLDDKEQILISIFLYFFF